MSDEERIYFDRDGMTITSRWVKTDRHTFPTQAIHRIEEQFSPGAKYYHPILIVMGVSLFAVVIGSDEFILSLCLLAVFLVIAGAFNIAIGKRLIVHTERERVVVAKDKPWWVIREMRLALERAMSERNQ